MYYTQYGKIVYNPEAYASTGAPMYDSDGENVNEETSLYVAKLENGKKYIGKTKDFDRRCNQHFSGNGSRVTQKYSPIHIQEVDVVPGYLADKYEQELTEMYVRRYGYSSVRGGRYTNSKNF